MVRAVSKEAIDAVARMRDRCLSIYNGPEVHRDCATITEAFNTVPVGEPTYSELVLALADVRRSIFNGQPSADSIRLINKQLHKLTYGDT